MSRAVVILDTEFQRRRAQDWVWAAKSGSRVEFKGPKRSPEQNSLMWSLLTEVAVHMRKTAGLDYSTEEWKHIFLHGWGREIRFLPSLDGKSVVPIPQSSSDLSKEEMTDFIEFILKEGAERGVKFHEPSDVPPVASDEGSGGDGSPGLIPAAATDQEHGAPMEDGPGTAATTGSSSQPSQKDCLEAFMRTATDPALSVQERRELLAEMKDWWKAEMPDHLEFVKACLSTADKVAKGEIQPPVARRYLEGLM